MSFLVKKCICNVFCLNVQSLHYKLGLNCSCRGNPVIVVTVVYRLGQHCSDHCVELSQPTAATSLPLSEHQPAATVYSLLTLASNSSIPQLPCYFMSSRRNILLSASALP